MNSFSDEPSLVAAVLRREKAALRELVRAYEGLVLHIVTPLIKDEHDRADITQDVFVKVYEKLHTFRFQSKLSTWIGNIAYNTSVNFLKKKKTMLLDDLLGTRDANDCLPLAAASTSPDLLLIQKQDSALLHQAIDRLPALQKSMLLLFHQDELSLQEISAVVEMPLNTVKSHLFRARKTLKDLLTRHQY